MKEKLVKNLWEPDARDQKLICGEQNRPLVGFDLDQTLLTWDETESEFVRPNILALLDALNELKVRIGIITSSPQEALFLSLRGNIPTKETKFWQRAAKAKKLITWDNQTERILKGNEIEDFMASIVERVHFLVPRESYSDNCPFATAKGLVQNGTSMYVNTNNLKVLSHLANQSLFVDDIAIQGFIKDAKIPEKYKGGEYVQSPYLYSGDIPGVIPDLLRSNEEILKKAHKMTTLAN